MGDSTNKISRLPHTRQGISKAHPDCSWSISVLRFCAGVRRDFGPTLAIVSHDSVSAGARYLSVCVTARRGPKGPLMRAEVYMAAEIRQLYGWWRW